MHKYILLFTMHQSLNICENCILHVSFSYKYHIMQCNTQSNKRFDTYLRCIRLLRGDKHQQHPTTEVNNNKSSNPNINRSVYCFARNIQQKNIIKSQINISLEAVNNSNSVNNSSLIIVLILQSNTHSLIILFYILLCKENVHRSMMRLRIVISMKWVLSAK